MRLEQNQYQTIFEHKPSFNEKKAFVGMFRKKWKEDRGYCSLFDKIKQCRLAKSQSLDKVERRKKSRQAMRDKAMRLLEQARVEKEQEEQPPQVQEVILRPKSLELQARMLIENQTQPDVKQVFMTAKHQNLVDIMRRTELRHSAVATRA